MQNRHKLKQNQSGLVSIMVTMVIMIVISLIVVAFARIARREQRQALDRQLSSQAFYAAESGVNNAVEAIQGGYTENKTDCTTDTGNSSLDDTKDLGDGISITCLLIDQAPGTLEYDSIGTAASKVFRVQPDSGKINKLTFSWQAADNEGSFDLSGCRTPGVFPDNNNWLNCDAGVLRLDLVPFWGNVGRDTLLGSTLTAFLYPQNNNNPNVDHSYTGGYNTGNNGAIITGGCSTSSPRLLCTVTITNLGGLGDANTNAFYVKLRSIYKASRVQVSAEDTNGNQALLRGAQKVIDATGKSNDVLRRIVVRVPSENLGGAPDYAIASGGSICKRFSVMPNDATVEPPYNTDPSCQLPGTTP